MKKPLMNNAYPNGYLGDGVFTDLQNLDVPWKSSNIETSLDSVYFSKSGEKTVSNVISKRVDSDGVLSAENRSNIATYLVSVFGVQWTKLYETLTFDYNPIENYRMVESESLDSHNESSGSDTGTIGREAANGRTDTGTVGNSGTDNTDNSVYGFNSSSAVNSDASNSTNNNTETRNLAINETVDETETRNLANTSESDKSETRELTRSGNIGVTTSQQMIESERDLWQWNYFNIVFNDIDSLLCLPIYSYEMECD